MTVQSIQKSVVFYCGENVELWGPQSLWQGIGGSEEALIHMTRQLRDLGWHVEVYGTPPDGSAGDQDGVYWYPFQKFDRHRCGDVFIAWRDAEYVLLGEKWRQVYHWLHNRQDFDYRPEIADRLDRILLVSRHHGTDEGFAEVDPTKLYFTSNGLDEEFLCEPGSNDPRRAIYASCPARGLLTVLQLWPLIKKSVPDAKLDIYHGFGAVYAEMARFYPGLLYVKKQIMDLYDQEGITVHGMVGHDRLARGFAHAGVWLYPTECLETSCITAMKALAMGCLPVTSGYGVLGETLGGRDLGPVHPSKRITASRLRRWRYLRRVVKAMRQGDRPEMRAKRLEWSRWAREKYCWKKIARDWCRLFDEVHAQKSALNRQ